MGNNQPTDQNGSQEHERLGVIKINEAQDPQTHQIFNTMQLTRSVESEKVLQGWLKETNKIDDSETRQVLLLPLRHEFKKAGMCGATGLVTLTYESYSFILENEIKNRQGLSKYFLETQMWYLLYNMIRAGNKFQRIKTKIGDVHPNNILINDDGQVKIISTCSLPNELTNFQKAVENKDTNVFLAPQELDQAALSKGDYPSGVDPCKAEVFSIGLTLLSSATLQSCDLVYQKIGNARKINFAKIRDLIGSLSQKYNPLLIQNIASMLQQSPVSRKRASEIYTVLFPYENEILQLQPFNLPMKVSTNTHQAHFSQYAQGTGAGNYGYSQSAYGGHQISNAGYNNQRPVSTATYGYPQNGSYQTGGGFPYSSQRY